MSENKNPNNKAYPPIGDYGFIADCHSAALVSKVGSIDWCCMPRIDSRSMFARLLDWREGGYCQIRPTERCSISRRYLPDTLVLETTFETESGKARLLDCLTMRKGGKHNPRRQILRVVEGLEGEMAFELKLEPRFDYGAIKPFIRKMNGGLLHIYGGSDGLLVSGDFEFSLDDHQQCECSVTVTKGDRARLSLLYEEPEKLDDGVEPPDNDELDKRLDETISWWEEWTQQVKIEGDHAEMLKRSAIVLKGLSHAPTGAIAAAPTTSLPEAIGAGRNWDYRFTWIRDSVFTVRSLAWLGYLAEADGVRRFVERSAAGNARELQILYGVDGSRRLYEYEVQELSGYRGSSPVRIGNHAESQAQHDVYGELLDLAYNWHERGNSPDDDYWDFIADTLDVTVERWKEPDSGMWEIRSEPRHFTLSKTMCWSALDCGTRMADELEKRCADDKWKKTMGEIREYVEEHCYDQERGIFIQAKDHGAMDASLLLLPMFRFVRYDDDRMIRTVDQIIDELTEDGLVRRYRADDDQMEGREGVFLTCSFWLAEILAHQDRMEEAKKFFDRAVDTSNDLGLFAEEWDTDNEEMLGNFPQGLTHLSYIMAALSLRGDGQDRL